MKLRNTTNCDKCCKGKRISELDEKVDIQGTEYIPYQEGDDNGKFSLGSLKDYLIKLIEEYLINNGIIREDWVQSEPAYKLLATLPELIADRACKDEFGNNINDTYLTRESVKEYIGGIFEDLFTENPPKILDGYITIDMLSDAVLQLLNSGGAITNFPDDEDLTVKDGKLKFKDKAYDPNNYSGFGKKYLRRNMVDGVNVLTQEMMSEPNVIYVIQYDYDLRGETINIPENCALQFEGGSFNNGTLVGNNTSINSDKENIIFKDITISGLWNVPVIYDTWFYFNSTDKYPNNNLIKSILNLSNENIHNTIYFTSGRKYWFEVNYKGDPALGTIVRPLYGKLSSDEYSELRIFTEITSNTKLVIDSEFRLIPTNQGAYFCFFIANKSNIEICGTGAVYGDADTHIYDTPFVADSEYYGEWGHCFLIGSCTNVVIRDITIGYAFGDGLYIGSNLVNVVSETEGTVNLPSKNVIVDNVKVIYARRNGVVAAGYNINILNVYFEGNGSDEVKGTAPKAGIDFESDYVKLNKECVCKNVIMSNCTFKNNAYDITSTNATTEDATDYAVQINNCNFTSKLRLNATFWLKFYNCCIPAISEFRNQIGSFAASRYIRYENCQFGELYPYLQMNATKYKQEFINCSSVNNIEGNKVYSVTLGNKRVLKMSIPRSLAEQAIVTFTAFSNASNQKQTTIRYTYLLGDSNTTRFDDAKLYYRNDTTPRASIYSNIFALSKPVYDNENSQYIVYGALGATAAKEEDSASYNGLIYYNYISLGKVKSTGTGTEGGIAISGGEYSKLYDIKYEEITIDDVPENVVFLKEEVFNISDSISSLPTYEAFQGGRQRMLTDQKKTTFYDSIGGKWVDSDGFILHEKTNTEEELKKYMLKLSSADVGADFFGRYIKTPLYWDGVDFLNSDGSVFLSSSLKSLKRTIQRIIDTPQTTFGYSDCTYNITKDIDLNGETVNIRSGCSLEFNGGKIINGTINLNHTKLPQGCNIADYITATISGTYKEGQILYDPSLKKMKLWNGTSWVNLDGTALA